MTITYFDGNSGCVIKVIEIHGKKYVRKYAGSSEYSERLQEQCIKQELFNSKYFDVPKVHAKGFTNNGIFWFDMDYISGVTLSKYMESIPLVNIDCIVDRFFHIIPEKYEYDQNAGYSIYKKINSLKDLMCGNPDYMKYLDHLEKYDWAYVVKSECHGDFTLENMIVSDKRIHLIDFLDSFYDSWMIDYAKILQDVNLGWSYRYTEIDVNLKIRLLVMKKMVHERIGMLEDGDKILDTIYHLLLLNILRIVPYIKDKTTDSFISRKSEYLYSILR